MTTLHNKLEYFLNFEINNLHILNDGLTLQLLPRKPAGSKPSDYRSKTIPLLKQFVLKWQHLGKNMFYSSSNV